MTTTSADAVSDAPASPGGHGPEGRAPAVRRALGGIYWPLAVLVAVGVLLRAYLVSAYAPMAQNMADSIAYLGMARDGLYQDPGRNSGYPAFLRVVHAISDELTVTILLQHALGVATGLLAYAAARRLGAHRPLALIPAAVVLLSLDQILLEHTLLTEALFTFLLVAGLYAAVRIVPGRPGLAWALAAGLALGAAFAVRTAILPLLPLIVVWVAVALRAPWRARLLPAAAMAAGMGVVMFAYLGGQNASVGSWEVSRAPGWALYARTAPFADCSEFTPPRGTERLCETTPDDTRNGPDYYAWVGGPAREAFGGSPNGGEQLAAFARAAIRGEPTDYAQTVGQDFMRYFIHDFGTLRPYGGVGPELTEVDRRAPGLEEQITAALGTWYEPTTLDVEERALARLGEIQDVARVHGRLLLVMVLLGLAAIVLCRGRARMGAILMMGTTIGLLLIPVATAIYSQRYAVPVAAPAGVAAALALAAAWERLRPLVTRRLPGAPSAAVPD